MNSARDILLFVLFLCIPAVLAGADEIRVIWPEARNATAQNTTALGLPTAANATAGPPLTVNATKVMSRAEVLRAGFEQAVYKAALELLPGELAPDRIELLEQYLAPLAGDYILSYSEVGLERDPVRTMILDVNVNRQALKSALKRLGVYYTVDEPQPFDLRFSAGAQAYWEELGRLSRLSGLKYVDGSEPRLLLELGENATLTGILSAEDREWSASSKDIQALWVDLWSSWFTRPEAEEGVFQESVLVVAGWFTPDGVRSFDQQISSWEREVESAVLTEVEMLPDGITARWSIRALDLNALKERLSSYLLDRGLSYAFEEEPDAGVDSGEAGITAPGGG